MNNKWQLDKNYIQRTINNGIDLLKNPTLSKLERLYLKEDLEHFKNYLINQFEEIERESKYITTIEKIKDIVLKKMKKQYKELNEQIINFIIDLNYSQILILQTIKDITELSVDEQAELTLQTYQEHSKYFLPKAKEIISPNPTPQIQETKNISSSYCYYCDINSLPFIFINPEEPAWTLNHEVQHGIEDILNINPHYIYQELGPILFELLFIDTLYKDQGYILDGDYKDRLDDIAFKINNIAQYFTIMKLFAKTDFIVPTDIFLNSFNELVDTDNLIQFFNEDIIGGSIDYDIQYVFSYLKALELRSKILSNPKKESFEILKEYLLSKRFKFNPSLDKFNIYKTYTEEMKSKTRIFK